MKPIRQILLVVAVILSAHLSQAQEGYLAIRGGYSSTSLNADGTSDIKLENRHTWHMNLVYSRVFKNSMFGFSVEPGYAIRGIETNRDSISYKFNYLSTPLLVDFYPIKDLRVGIGPEVSFLLGAKNRKNDSTKVDITDMYDNVVDISGTISVSYSLSFFADFGFRYNRSFTNIASSDAILNRRNLANEYVQVFLLLKIAN